MTKFQRIWLGCMTLAVLANGTPLFGGTRQLTVTAREADHIFVNPINVDGQSLLLTDDFADGVGTHVRRYLLIAREVVNPSTGEVSQGAFIMLSADGSTISGRYSGQATFGSTSLRWVANGEIIGGTGRFKGATGTINFEGSSDLSTCKSVDALSTCEFTEDTRATISLPDRH